ncbi:MAG: DUF1574 domain-containing protein [Lachnospiraceae bacterium]|nr:DUF1574 domain-containing protein [Lachnospiraceae bacterium]
MKKSMMRIVSFLVILTLILAYWNKVFKVKFGDGINDLNAFYRLEEDSVDLLVLGSSHAFENINTGTLWDQYGIAAYNLCGSVQPMWNTYYYLKEALKYQTPKLIILEGYCTVCSAQYSDDSRIIKNNFGLRWSKDKIASMMVSAPKERWKDFFLEYSQYHNRYKELAKEDFLKNQGNNIFKDWKGFGLNLQTTPSKFTDVSGITEKKALSEKTEKYYRKTIELAKEKSIPIIVIITPYTGCSTEHQMLLNSAGDIAKEYSVPFFNYNGKQDEMGIDSERDIADLDHLNYRGSEKFTKYLGKQIANKYQLPDRRGEDLYNSWQRSADYIRQQICSQELAEETDTKAYIEKTHNPNYWVFVSVDGDNPDKEVAQKYLSTLGDDTGSLKPGVWYIKDGKCVWNTNKSEKDKYISHKIHDFHLLRTKDAEDNNINQMIVDNETYKNVENGMNIVVYDTMSEKVVDNVGLDATNNYMIVRNTEE